MIINPQDAELEEAMIGACLVESKAIALIASKLRPEIFYQETNCEIYATLQSMYDAGLRIDIITIKEELAKRRKLDAIGGPYTLARISGGMASSVHLTIIDTHHLLDRLTAGWQPTDLIIIGARPAVGKTAFALHLARSAASAGHHVLVYNLERMANA